MATSRLPTHISDFTAVDGDHRDDFLISVENAGNRTSLFVPLLKDDEIVGLISLARKQVQPFSAGRGLFSTHSPFDGQFTLEDARYVAGKFGIITWRQLGPTKRRHGIDCWTRRGHMHSKSWKSMPKSA
ncbi:GAF domain-containing protein [Bradyrhizobium sp. F1.13.3]|uniref:GAF domain-containing protein n=1 Tax=Bradyrhizobium sp. F1.13.3 TaxID=3156351 RepID=UPI003391D167